MSKIDGTSTFEKTWEDMERGGLGTARTVRREQDSLGQHMCCTSKKKLEEAGPFLERIVTGDEKWILYDNRTRSKQWLSKRQPPVPTPKPNLCLRKTLLCVWWDIHGIIHYELLKPVETITADVYCQKRLHKKTACLANRPTTAFTCSKCDRD